MSEEAREVRRIAERVNDKCPHSDTLRVCDWCHQIWVDLTNIVGRMECG